MDTKLSKDDLEAAVDVVYETVSRRGRNTHHEANHQLMDTIKELGLGDNVNRNCWNELWNKYRDNLVELGYVPGY